MGENSNQGTFGPNFSAELKSEIRAEAELLPENPPTRGESLRGRRSVFLRLRGDSLRFRPAYKSRFENTVHYQDLVVYDDREFVQNAYIALLRHAPDPQGEAFYVNLLRRGRAKIEVFFRLRLSGEGRSQGVAVKGFWPYLFWEGLLQIPGPGYLIRLLKELLFLPRTLRELQTRQERMREHINIQNREITKTVNSLIQSRRELNELRRREKETRENRP